MIEKIKEKIIEICERYEREFGKDWTLDKVDDFFDEVEKAIKSLGGKVVEKYVAPNGYISFEYSGEIWTCDLSYGFFRGRNIADALAWLLAEKGFKVMMMIEKDEE